MKYGRGLAILLLLLALSLPARAAPTDGLVGHWTFDDGGGTTAADSSGNGNNGALVNGPTWAAGKIGTGTLVFDGIDDAVSIGAPATLNLDTNYTITFWVLPPALSYAGTIIRLSSSTSNSTRKTKYEIRISNSAISFSTGDGNAGSDDNDIYPAPTTNSSWHMVTCTLLNNTKACYKNTVLLGTSTNDVNSAANIPSSGLIGTNRNLAGNNFFRGSLDDVRIYNRVLSQAEIMELYALGSGTTDPGDKIAPSLPANLHATAVSSSRINLSWNASTDNIAVAWYRVYRDGAEAGTSATNTYGDIGLSPGTMYTYAVAAYDAANNFSAQSGAASAITHAAAATICSSISQHGITWFFDREYSCGAFANGDYWVLGPVTITRIAPDFADGNNGWEVNPKVQSRQGFQSNGPHYDPSLMPALPYTATGSQSIVKVIGGNKANNISVVKMAAVLTVLMEVPPDNGSSVFRPPYIGDAKPLYRVSDLKTNLLPAYAPVGTPPTLAALASTFSQGLRMDHDASVPRHFRPFDVMKDYQPENTAAINNALLRLMLNDSIENKKPALIQVTQHALDRAYAVLNGYRHLDDGHNPNHRILAGWAAVLLGIQAVKDVLMAEGTIMHEDAFILKPREMAVWGQSGYPEQFYWNYIITGNGSKSMKDPYGYIDGGKLGPSGASYQNIVVQSQKGEVLATYLMPALSVSWRASQWPVDSGYIDRWVALGVLAQPDPCAPYDGNAANYGKTFGPDGKGGCILDTNSDDGIGRFPQFHGANRDGGQYRSAFVAAMWGAYRNSPGIPINGSCGAARNSCTSGTFSDATDTGTEYLWQCRGINGGTGANCSLPMPLDSDLDGVADFIDKCPFTPASLASYVNTYGCPKPIATEFNIKPNFDSIDLNAGTAFELGVRSLGKITFNRPIRMVRIVNNIAQRLDFDSDIDISSARVTLNPANQPDLNGTATITLYNLSFKNPEILRNNSICTDCNIISYSAGTLVFSVPHFST